VVEINNKTSFEIGDRVLYNKQVYKVFRKVRGYFEESKQCLVYDYIITNGEDMTCVSENEIKILE